MHSFRVATGLTGLIVVTAVLLVTQSVSGAPAPFLGVTALPIGAQPGGAAGGAVIVGIVLPERRAHA